jgi:hypothetical protein
MKTLLMHRDRNFDWQRELPAQAENLIQDLGLQVLFKVMSGGDEFLLQVVQRGVLWSLTEPEAIVYRQQALSDCLDHPAIVRAIYDLTVETLVAKKKIFGWFSHTPEQNLRYAVQVLELLVRMLKRLRQTALENRTLFKSPAFKRFFAMLVEELDDEYFAAINEHLRQLQFRRGVLINARLGKGNSALDIVLSRPSTEKQRWSELIFGPRDGRLWFDVHPRDDGGHQALSELQARGVNLVANALTQSTEHVLGFVVQLRAELAFYLGCLNLQAALNGKGFATSLPRPKPASKPSLSGRGLYDAALALVASGDVVSNDLSAGSKGLVVITGANQGGKSTFLRSVGLAQLLMQAGMFDARPRSRELVYILVAERAARALGELFMQSNEMTLEQAAAFACAQTPRGWLRMDGSLVRDEQHLYLQQPGYGTSYLIGKIELEKLLSERREQLGEAFRMKQFMDDFNAAGLIPASLLRWEMTGRKSDELARVLE